MGGIGQLSAIVRCKLLPVRPCTAKGRFRLSAVCSRRRVMPVHTKLSVFSQPASLRLACAEYMSVSTLRTAITQMVQISHDTYGTHCTAQATVTQHWEVEQTCYAVRLCICI